MSKHDVSFDQVSPRRRAALAILAPILCLQLDEVYGGGMERGEDKGKSFWALTFCRARYIDGTVHIYSDRFIQIKYTRAGRETRQVCRSTYEAKRFLMEKFL